ARRAGPGASTRSGAADHRGGRRRPRWPHRRQGGGARPARARTQGAGIVSAPDEFALCVFCGARDGASPVYRALAEEVGRRIAQRGWTVVYGGGDVGLMGALAGGALDAGGKVIGIIPRALLRQEQGKHEVTRLEVVESMALRKERMIAISDA